MKFHAVIFDLDGTLLDTLDDIARAMNSTLSQAGHPTHDLDFYRTAVGDGLEMLVRRSLPEDRVNSEQVTAGMKAMKENYGRHCMGKTRPYPGISELLDRLKDKGLPMNVLSNKPDDLTRKIVHALLGAWPFVHVAGLKPELPRKPDPTSALLMARALEVTPARCLYLGDTGTDMKTATAAGMFAVGVLWGFRSEEELKAAGAEILIEHPMDLLDVLNERL